jgi:hypothetical protein
MSLRIPRSSKITVSLDVDVIIYIYYDMYVLAYEATRLPHPRGVRLPESCL